MARPLWFVKLLKRNFNYRFFGAQLTNLPIIGKLMEKILFNEHQNGDALFYLPKDHVIINQEIEQPGSMVLPSVVVDHFINKANYHFLMHECLCRDANGCKDYPKDLGCLFLGEAVKDINPRLGRLVTREEALAHAKRARDLGLVHLIGRDKIDAVWMGVNASTKLMTLCNCCPCCCLFKFVPHLSPKLRAKLERMPGVSVVVHEEKCIGCGKCLVNTCFVNAIHVVDGKAVIDPSCHGCANCVEACPTGALELHIDNADYINKAIQRLEEAVDVE